MNKRETTLEMNHIQKAFPGVLALDNIHFSVEAGEVHALLGENGAGKSTLIKIIGGIYHADAGEITFEGKRVEINSIQDAKALGISVVHQELSLCPNMTVAENVYLGEEITTSGSVFCNDREMDKGARQILRQLNIDIDPQTKIKELSIAQQQMVEIARAVSGKIKLLVLDEPTGTLTNKETDKLFELIALLKGRGVSIIYISHRLEELFRIADRVTVLRDGKYIDTVAVRDATYKSLVNMLVGREMTEMYPCVDNPVGDVLLEVRGLSRGRRVKNVSFTVREGEILGFYGLIGSGRTEIMRMLYGVDRPDEGEILVKGERLKIQNVDNALQNGISLVPENRKEQGLVLIQGVDYNITLSILKRLYNGLREDKAAADSIVEEYIHSLSIKTPSKTQKTMFLSGGNQQKVVVAKNLATAPKILILDEPTRGIDVGAKKEIYDIIVEFAKRGVSIIMVSSEMPEIIHLCNRLIVMYEGSISGTLQKEQINESNIIQLAMGKECR